MALIRLGSIGPEVEDIQRRLADLGFVDGCDLGVFDAVTLAAVRAFQQHRGLPADGIVGPDTWGALVGASYRLGDRLLYERRPTLRGDDVRDLQRRISRLGFDAGYDDGIYGAQTAEAVRDFQLNAGLVVDGMAGPATTHALCRLARQHQQDPAYVVRERQQLRHRLRSSLAGARILLDPARGEADPGPTAPDGTPEHHITWAIAALTEGRLAALGANVVLSRGPWTTPTPSQRAAHANAEDVEVIISVRCNHHPTSAAQGIAGYHFGTERYVSERGRRLAELAVDRLVTVTGSPHCRIHPSTVALLRESRAPAVIIEVGFLSHPAEGTALTDRDHQRVIAEGLVDALTEALVGEAAWSVDPSAPAAPGAAAPVRG